MALLGYYHDPRSKPTGHGSWMSEASYQMLPERQDSASRTFPSFGWGDSPASKVPVEGYHQDPPRPRRRGRSRPTTSITRPTSKVDEYSEGRDSTRLGREPGGPDRPDLPPRWLDRRGSGRAGELDGEDVIPGFRLRRLRPVRDPCKPSLNSALRPGRAPPGRGSRPGRPGSGRTRPGRRGPAGPTAGRGPRGGTRTPCGPRGAPG